MLFDQLWYGLLQGVQKIVTDCYGVFKSLFKQISQEFCSAVPKFNSDLRYASKKAPRRTLPVNFLEKHHKYYFGSKTGPERAEK